MPLNIEDPLVEALVAEVARLTGETEVEAVRRSLEERRDRLAGEPPGPGRAARLRRFLEDELWPVVPPATLGQRITTSEAERILGYGEDGV